ncbi:MAG: 30S ribosomal protein S16 [Candidatus Coatesbacteria bacterium]
MVTIRLMRVGKRSQPQYRVAVLDSRRKNNGACLETLGTWVPRGKGEGLKVKLERVKIWQARGASVSPTVRGLLKRAGR